MYVFYVYVLDVLVEDGEVIIIVSINWIREIITGECEYHVSNECLMELRGIMDSLCKKIVTESIREFEELNKRRKMQGLRELKRLNAYSVKRGIDNVFNGCVDVDMGLQTKKIANQWWQ